MSDIHLRFQRFSAFYSPILVTLAGGHLATEGLEATFDIAGPGRPVEDGLRDGSVQVTQSAVAAHFGPWSQGVSMPFRHFALVNRHDGFFLARRGGPGPFEWADLRGRSVLADHYFQPLALLTAAMCSEGIGVDEVDLVDAGGPDAMAEAFRSGQGDFVHLQGPAPHLMEAVGLATVVASIGSHTPELAFSTLGATDEWLATPDAAAFTRAYLRGREHASEAPPEEVARLIAGFLRIDDRAAITAAVAGYQTIGTWKGKASIDTDLYRATVEVFATTPGHDAAPPYDVAVAPLPGPH